ncbi:MAG TPA: TlpA disulfide reductase family protein [Kofleriaceae bacterium]|jgi:thiol-disulfide isomerase/thioredoxin
MTARTGFVGRLGLAIAGPRRALAIAGAREHAGRSGSDLLAAIAILLVATELRWIVQALWLGAVVDATLGVRALVHVLTGTLSIDLGLLVVAAAVIAFAGGLWRQLGRAFDLACVAVLPLVFVDLAAGVVFSALRIAPPAALRVVVIGAAYAWTAALVALAIGAARGKPVTGAGTTRTGWLVVALALAGVAVQVSWVAQNVDVVRPLEPGARAPAIALARIGAGGKLGERVSIAPGKITVLDFWATWCGPCLRSLPELDRFARSNPDVDVLTINLDDPAEARRIFDREHYALNLLADDGQASERYGVEAIPHTVLVDPHGDLVTDRGFDLAQIAKLRREQ